MKLLFDLTLLREPRTGIGIYLKELLEVLIKDDKIRSIKGFCGSELVSREVIAHIMRESDDHKTVAKKTTDWRRKVRVLFRGVPGAYPLRQALRDRMGTKSISKLSALNYIYHEPNYIPVQYSGPLVVTAHDLSQVRHPEFHPPERATFLNKHLGPVLQRADQIITVSDFSAQEIIDVYQIERDKITVTYLGADGIFHPRDFFSVAGTLHSLGLRHRGFVLFVATLEPRKNIIRLIAAHASLPKSLREEYPLVLTGAAGWQDSDILSRIRTAERKGEVIRTGYLPRIQLADLFSSAAVFAYPSLYEGFGLPVLEGFVSGTPVLTSNITSMPEISAGAAVEVDPYSVEAIGDGLQRLLEDQMLADAHIEAGLIRARDFSWRTCAEKTLEVYHRIS